MANKKKDDSKIVKSFKLKMKINETESIFWKSVGEEYQEYWQKVSDYINSIMKKTIKEIADMIPEEKHNEGYYKNMMKPNVCDQQVYKMFCKGFSTQDCNNIIHTIVKNSNILNYHGNMLNMADTYYLREGIIANVCSNYFSKLSNSKPNIKPKRITETSSDEEIMSQVIYEMVKNNINNKDDWKKQLEYLKNKSQVDENYLKRIQILYDFYIKNCDNVHKCYEDNIVNTIINFDGCKRKKITMSLSCQKMKIECDEQTYTYKFNIGKNLQINAFGHRSLIRDNKQFINICEKHGQNITIKSENGVWYIIITTDVDFTKTYDDNIKNCVGIDINTKHMLLQTSIKNIKHMKDYFNIYDAIVNDEVICNLLTKNDKEVFKSIAKTVSFGIFEIPYLFTRVSERYNLPYNKNNREIEKELTRLLKEKKKYYDSVNPRISQYIQCCIRLREQILSYFTFINIYNKLQQEFDKNNDYKDASTASKETMDIRRFENPFRNTKEAQQIIEKRSKIEREIIGTRNNIIEYAYYVLNKNNYDTIALENLESSQFEKMKIGFPTIVSLLKFHKFENKNINTLKDNETYINNCKYYDFILNDKNEIIDAKYTKAAVEKQYSTLFYNVLIKCIHFADIKDKFVQLSNNKNTKIVLVPSYFTSQMDSITHTIYIDENNKLINKNLVRKNQETHINGLNADFNAANNIQFIASNNDWRNEMCKLTKNKYGEPIYDTKIKSKQKMITIINKKLHASKIFIHEKAV